MFENFEEPKGAFPYKAPSEELRNRYKYMYEQLESPKMRMSKRLFDICVSVAALIVFFIPSSLLLFAYFVEQVFVKQNRGPFLYYYNSISQG